MSACSRDLIDHYTRSGKRVSTVRDVVISAWIVTTTDLIGKRINILLLPQKKEERNHETQNAIRVNQFGVGSNFVGNPTNGFGPTLT